MTLSIESYYMKFLRCARCSHDFEYENPLYRPITLPICGHTMCRQCIDIIRNQTKCPQDQLSQDTEERYGQCPSYMKFDKDTKLIFNAVESAFGKISLEIKPIINNKQCQSILSRSMIRKIFSLLNSQYIDRASRLKVLKAIRSLGEHMCIDFILRCQNPQQVTDNFRSVIGLQSDQFLEPAVQEIVLQSIASLKDHSTLSNKHLVHSVVLQVGANDPNGSKPSVNRIVNLLSDASCFQVQQDGDSLSMKLKSEFQNYESLRRAYDSHIMQVVMKDGFYISSEQSSSLLYGDKQHELSMQSIIDKLSTPGSFSQAIQQLGNVLKKFGVQNNDEQRLSNNNQEYDSNWTPIETTLNIAIIILKFLINFKHH
ncbi:unnamed protein product [Rotaria magnacalcarata]|uniref:RING-type E3 ubiquitin transferase n=2 Tax=Rotaria magnacalcarata TaxID=392030 RepID=A0A816N4H3_9BILA|nr:unnamed protein product [Rotaria magnacalcarata]